MITIVVPSYNVEKYIDRCIDSIVNQTFSDFEVIIVDGNSSDDTRSHIDKWVQKDSRITCIIQKSKGLGPARDEGVAAAKGEYITFIDSDDWWDLTYLDKMITALKSADADICMCDRLNIHFDSYGNIEREYLVTKPIMQDTSESFKDNPEILHMLEVSVNGKLFKKNLFIDNNIVTPACAAEDRAVMHYLLYKAERVTRVYEPLYCYHAAREGSLVNTVKAWSTIDVCLDKIHEYFDNECIDELSLKRMLRTISIEVALAAVNSIKNVSSGNVDLEAETLINKIKQYHWKRYPDLFEKMYLIGGYSLRREAWLAYHSFDESRVHQQFSSIISLMSVASNRGKIDTSKIVDNNRKRWLENDFSKEFIFQIKPGCNEYIFLDFIEERFDIGKFGDTYFTWNDLYEELDDKLENAEMIERLSDEADVLFEDACDNLIDYLMDVTTPNHIILVRNRLSEKMGVYSGTALFFNNEWIQAINAKLDKYYDYFINNCPGVIVIVPNENESFFSQEDFPFGCAPYHINDAYYHNVAYLIRNIICE